MSLSIHTLLPSDFPTILSHASLHPPGTDLVAPPYLLVWPVSTRAEASARLQFAMGKQAERLAGDSTARYLKVIEHRKKQQKVAKSQYGVGGPVEQEVAAEGPREAGGEVEVEVEVEEEEDIIALARWHVHPNGPPRVSQLPLSDPRNSLHWELAQEGKQGEESDKSGALPSEGRAAFNAALHDHILTVRDIGRERWIPADQECWILTHLIVRPDRRGKGAAGMCVRWGLDKAAEKGCGAYLEAGVQGKPIYEKYGFTQVGETVKIDCRPYGVDVVFEMANMVCWPGKHGQAKESENEMKDSQQQAQKLLQEPTNEERIELTG